VGTKLEDTVRRREAIVKLVQQLDEVDVEDISESVGASGATIRRDLAHLEELGMVVRTHGGARAIRSISALASTFDERKRTMSAEKKAVAAAAAKHIEPGMTVALDVGSTALYLVYELQNTPPRQVITSSLIFMETLLQIPDLIVSGCSGELRRWNLDFVGYQTRECFERWHPDVSFLTCTSYRPGKGLYKIDPKDAEIVRAMCYSTGKAVLLIDHTKINGPGRIRTLPAAAIDHIIVDDGVSAEKLRMLEGEPAQVEVAPIESASEATNHIKDGF
jgi:DeoR/GlpR family transcriptional regulator of sugar metabolism